MMALFSSKLLITSDADLRYYLKKNKKPYNLTQNGGLIFALDQLHSVSKEALLNKKTGIIVNTLQGNAEASFGHWVLLLINKAKQCLFVDSLATTFQTNRNLKNTVIAFCTKHNLELFIWRVKSQTERSQSCGFQIIFFLDFFSKYNMAMFCKLRRLLKSFSLKQAELYILRKAYALCSRSHK